MIPPPLATMQAVANQNTFASNKLTQQMQDLKLDGSSQSAQLSFDNKLSYNNQTMSPQHRPQMPTTVTYSGHPRATYPYTNNNPSDVSGHNIPGTNIYNQQVNNSSLYSQSPVSSSNVVHGSNNTRVNSYSHHPLGSSVNNGVSMQPPSTMNIHAASNGYDLVKPSQGPSQQSLPQQLTPQQPGQGLPPQQLNQIPSSHQPQHSLHQLNQLSPAHNVGQSPSQQLAQSTRTPLSQGLSPYQMNQVPPAHLGQRPPSTQLNQGAYSQQMSKEPPAQQLSQSPFSQVNRFANPQQMSPAPPSQYSNFGQPQQNQNMPQTQQSPMSVFHQPPSSSSSMLGQQATPGMQSYNPVPAASQFGQQGVGYPDASPPPVSGFPTSQYGSMSPGSTYAGTVPQQGCVPPGQQGYPYSSQSPPSPPAGYLDQMPSMVDVREEDNKLFKGCYMTDVKVHPPPLVTSDFVAQDRGMCSPRYIRSSLYCLPNQPDMLKQTGIPFVVAISPLAEPVEGETDPPVALYREAGPLRCKRCKSYMCPFMTFLEGGRCFQCAFCKVVTEVPEDYFCFLDGMGERTDKYHRPELCLGSYEFVATKDYCRNDRLPNPPAYIFMLEVSSATFRNGLVPLLCENLKRVLQQLKEDENNDTSQLRVGFVTYNSVLHFYNLKKNLTHPHIMVLSDVHNAFVPLLDGFLVTLDEAEALVDCLMEHIPRLFINEPATEIILGPVVQVGLEALKNAECSGKLFIFHSSLPNADAPGKLQHRDGQKLLGTDKQKTVLAPQVDFYSKLAQDCVAAGCAVDIFLFPNAYVDIASLSPLCRHTGGQIYKYTYFQSHIDGDRFLGDLERDVTTTTAFDAVLRVRTSTGISPVFYYGNFYMSNTTDVELSAVDCYKAITIELAYDDKLPDGETMCIQAALLYTTCTGERRIRVHNLAIATTLQIADVFRSAEMDTIVNFLAKQTLKQVLEQNPQQVKSAVVGRAVKILACYRKNCSTGSPSAQLVLPDTLKLFPLFVNCLLKSDAITGGHEISLDDRSFAMLVVNSMDVKSTVLYLYPTLLALHDIDPEGEDVPKPIRCSIEKLSDRGAYLLENGIYMFLWLGQSLSSEWLQDVLGVSSTNQVDKERSHLPELDTALSQRVRQLIDRLQEDRPRYMRLTIMVQGDKLDIVFRQFLVEDRGTGDNSSSYVDFLCQLHVAINRAL